jgi:hypothetical protein
MYCSKNGFLISLLKEVYLAYYNLFAMNLKLTDFSGVTT